MKDHAKVFRSGGSQAVRIPQRYRLDSEEVTIHQEGERLILEPVKKRAWPSAFWRKIRITDESFGRPDQGAMPSQPPLDESVEERG